MRILGITESLNRLRSALDVSSKVYYVRFGDGELLLMNDDIRQTKGNQQKNSEVLRDELYESLNINDPLYLRAVGGSYPQEPGMVAGLFAPFEYRDKLDAILEYYLEENMSEFFNPVLFHYLGVFQPKLLYNFINKYIRNQSKMFVGGCSKEAMERFLGPIDVHVKIPSLNSYATINLWWKEIEERIHDVKVVVLAAGQSSRVIAKRLWNINAGVHCIDIGSIVDPIDGKFDTRTCWKMKGQEVMDYFYNDKG